MIASITTPELVFWIAACGSAIFLSALYSGSETGLYCLNRLRLNLQAAGEQNRAAVKLQRLLQDQPGMLFMTLLGTNVTNYLAPVCLTVIFLKYGVHESRVELYTSIILTPLVLVFGEILPKVHFERHADRVMIRVVPFLSLSYRLAHWTGFIAMQNALSRFIFRRFHRQAPSGSALHSRLEMYHLLHESGAQGALSRTQLFMLERVHSIRTIRVGSIMVPLHKVIMVPEDQVCTEAIAQVQSCDYSRLPVYRGDRRHLVGLVHALDILTASPNDPITRRSLPPTEVKYDTDVIEALSLLQRLHRRMAFVVDESGRCLGIVTVKDLVEEIVGDLPAW